MLCPPPPFFSFLSPAVIDLFPQLHVKSEPDELCLNLLSAIHVSFTQADSSKVDDKNNQLVCLSLLKQSDVVWAYSIHSTPVKPAHYHSTPAPDGLKPSSEDRRSGWGQMRGHDQRTFFHYEPALVRLYFRIERIFRNKGRNLFNRGGATWGQGWQLLLQQKDLFFNQQYKLL